MASADLPCGSDLGEVGSHTGPNGTQMQKFDLNLIDAQEDSTFIEFFTQNAACILRHKPDDIILKLRKKSVPILEKLRKGLYEILINRDPRYNLKTLIDRNRNKTDLARDIYLLCSHLDNEDAEEVDLSQLWDIVQGIDVNFLLLHHLQKRLEHQEQQLHQQQQEIKTLKINLATERNSRMQLDSEVKNFAAGFNAHIKYLGYRLYCIESQGHGAPASTANLVTPNSVSVPQGEPSHETPPPSPTSSGALGQSPAFPPISNGSARHSPLITNGTSGSPRISPASAPITNGPGGLNPPVNNGSTTHGFSGTSGHNPASPPTTNGSTGHNPPITNGPITNGSSGQNINSPQASEPRAGPKVTDIFIGGVMSDCDENTIRQHICSRLNIRMEPNMVIDLKAKGINKSFKATIPQEKYNDVLGIWKQGIYVRRFKPHKPKRHPGHQGNPNGSGRTNNTFPKPGKGLKFGQPSFHPNPDWFGRPYQAWGYPGPPFF